MVVDSVAVGRRYRVTATMELELRPRGTRTQLSPRQPVRQELTVAREFLVAGKGLAVYVAIDLFSSYFGQNSARGIGNNPKYTAAVEDFITALAARGGGLELARLELRLEPAASAALPRNGVDLRQAQPSPASSGVVAGPISPPQAR